MSEILAAVRDRAVEIWKKEDILGQSVRVVTGPLSVEQAIGDPGGGDFPIQKGKEKLMEAGVGDARGQAFTDDFGTHSATLGEIAQLPLDSNFNRAVFVAAFNAAMRSIGQSENTVHCRDNGPHDCAAQLPDYIRKTYGKPRITHVGFQPAMIESVGREFELRVLDLDPDNIGQTRRGVLVEGPEAAAEAIEWAELLMVTGTTLANATIDNFIDAEGRGVTGAPVLFYGTTIAAACDLMGWDRFCPMSS
ncbi:Rossmann-like domain-containing protein [Pseudodesulfovibrio senegalensis]|jgi:hypothetical protein|uniref:Putative heavy-metal chelation domain-containing protein n=1 Tax=Pseudodesulfovibrio senegalensis TaxID=1721087 RepID=A0A6N6N1F8_9BACT|nr:DUF364 domain-containing protein [Pseudodesulfovibrio senegalensis]KAB1441350.1 hypothetical protein F8A88_10390 [Pseudodesulfovibrio senegalensis]